MPSAANANGKSEKPASSEATDNSPVRQIMTIMEHKIRNLEKRKSKLTSYRDLQKSGKDLKPDQKVAVAKYDEVNQTLEFARDLSKQIAAIAVSAEREAKKQAKKEAWVRYSADISKIREILQVLDCLMQMGNAEAREDFLNGTNGAAKLTEADLKILDDLYPEVTPKHEITEEGQIGFPIQTTKAAEHLYSIIDGKPKEAFGTTYAYIKQIIDSVHGSGYFDKSGDSVEPEQEPAVAVEEQSLEPEQPLEGQFLPPPAPAAAVVPQPGYPLCPLPPITLQEVEHAYFAQQYPQQRPISEVIGSQNFFFLQESEIDSPASTPQPPAGPIPLAPPAPIPTQTFTNQHFVPLPGPPPLPLYVPLPEHPVFPAPPPAADDGVEEWKAGSPERDDERNKSQGQGDGQRFRRFGGRRPANGYRGRGAYQNRQNAEAYGRHGEYQGRTGKEGGYERRQYNDNYQSRHKEGYYGNGDTGNGDNGGFKGRGRGGPRAPRGAGKHFARNKPDNVE